MGKFVKKIAEKILRLESRKVVTSIPQPINMPRMLEGKVAMITGGSSGIGKSIAEAFLRAGCKVVICGTNEEKLANCRADLAQYGNVKSVKLDVSLVSEIDGAVEKAKNSFDENRIDILVNSAGVTIHKDFFSITEEDFDRVTAVNTRGMFFVSKSVAAVMKEQGKGHILNITSSSALRPAWNPYQISKWAERGLTLGLADKLLPYGITVNAIAPGPTATPMLGNDGAEDIFKSDSPVERYARPEEIASLAVYMVSDFGNLIIGDTVYITGGSGVISLHK